MATSAAFAGIGRRTSRLSLLRSVLNTSLFHGACDSGLVNFSSAAAPATTQAATGRVSAEVLGERKSGDGWTAVKVAVGILSGASLAVIGFRRLEENAALCNAATDLQTASLEEIEKSPLTASRKYSLLADTYRRQVFFNYERRIRLRSRPEKVFSYFASQRDPNGQPYMSPADLMRAVVPIFPPDGSTIIREGHLAGEKAPGELSCSPSAFFMLFDMNGDGLISFSEYIFFVTLLSIPEKNFKAAFKMFDLNGNGIIDRDEFQEVMRMMKDKTRQGLAHQSGYHGVKLSTSVENGGLVEWFFGKDGERQLRHEDFEKFLRDLHEEIIRLEFAHYDFKQKGTISAHDFGLSMIASADMNLLNEYLDRASALMKNPFYLEMRISPEEFHGFAELRKKLRKLARAMFSFGPMNKADFQRACSQVCSIPLSDAVVDIVFQIFDTNRDGYLSSEEFLHAMDRRENDIASPMETGLVHLLKCWWGCAQNCQSRLSNSWRV